MSDHPWEDQKVGLERQVVSVQIVSINLSLGQQKGSLITSGLLPQIGLYKTTWIDSLTDHYQLLQVSIYKRRGVCL